MQLFHSADASPPMSRAPDYEAPVDGLHLLAGIHPRRPTPLITRAEFVGGRFLYAVEVDTSDGFELCPADVCAVGDAFCPVGEEPRAKFTIIDGIDPVAAAATRPFSPPTASRSRASSSSATRDGAVYTYDVNTNTNYNPDAEARAGRSAMTELARFLVESWRRLGRPQPPLAMARSRCCAFWIASFLAFRAIDHFGQLRLQGRVVGLQLRTR